MNDSNKPVKNNLGNNLTSEEEYNVAIKRIQHTYGDHMFTLLNAVGDYADKCLGDDKSLDMRDELIHMVSRHMLDESVSGVCTTWADDTGFVEYDEDGEVLVDLDNKPLEYSEKGVLESKNVSNEMVEYIKQHYIATDEHPTLTRAV